MMQENLIKNPIKDQETILSLIPQRPPFVMVDSFFEYTPLTGRMGFHISTHCILLENGFFSEPGLIEHMAQSMSLHRGYRGFLAGLKKPQTGFIGAIKNVEIFSLPKVGEMLSTKVEILHEIMNVTSVSAHTTNTAGETICTSEMKTVTVD